MIASEFSEEMLLEPNKWPIKYQAQQLGIEGRATLASLF